MSIKQIPETAPVYTPERPGHDQEAWTAVRTLIERLNKLEQAQAGIQAGGANQSIALTANVWNVLPIVAVTGEGTPKNFTLASNQLTYTGAFQNNTIMCRVSGFIEPGPNTTYEIGVRESGNDAGVVFLPFARTNTVFSFSLNVGFVSNQNDFFEVVCRPGSGGTVTSSLVISVNSIYANIGANA